MAKAAHSQEAVDALNKRFGGQVVIPAKDVKRIPRVATGLLSMDTATKGGIPMGVPVMLSGRKSSGKSAWSYMMLGNACEQYGGFPIIVQSEPGFDWEWAVQCGLKRKDCMFFDASKYDVKENLQFLLDTMRKEKPTAILIDSLSGISDDPDKSLVDAKSHGGKAKDINEFFRKLTSAVDKDNPPLIIFIEHLHPDLTSKFPRLITTGGETKGYMAVVELRFTWRIDGSIAEEIEDVVMEDGKHPEWTVQKRIIWELKKSKVGADGAVGMFMLTIRPTDYSPVGEISDWLELLQRAIMMKHIIKRGPWYVLGESKFQGLHNLQTAISAEALRELISKPRQEDGEGDGQEDGGKGRARVRKSKGKSGGRDTGTVVDRGEDDHGEVHDGEGTVAEEDQV